MEDKMKIIIQSEGKPYLTDPMETLPQVLLPKSSLLRFTRFFVTPEIVACQAPLSMRILQARKLEWVAISSSRDRTCLQDRGRTHVFCIAGRFFTTETPGKPISAECPIKDSQWCLVSCCPGNDWRQGPAQVFLCPQSLTEASALPEHQPNLPWGCLTSLRSLRIPGCLALGEWSHHCGYLGLEDLFCIVLLCILATSS